MVYDSNIRNNSKDLEQAENEIIYPVMMIIIQKRLAVCFCRNKVVQLSYIELSSCHQVLSSFQNFQTNYILTISNRIMYNDSFLPPY